MRISRKHTWRSATCCLPAKGEHGHALKSSDWATSTRGLDDKVARRRKKASLKDIESVLDRSSAPFVGEALNPFRWQGVLRAGRCATRPAGAGRDRSLPRDARRDAPWAAKAMRPVLGRRSVLEI